MWTFAGGGRDQRSLVDYLVSQRRGGAADVSPAAIDAMKAVDRKEFIGPMDESRANVYLDSPAPIGHGQTISAPHMHLEMLDLLAPAIADKDHARVLDVGSGSGYLVACLWKMVAARGGEVVGVEKHAPLAQRSIQSLRRMIPEGLESGRVRVIAANVLAEGALDRGGELLSSPSGPLPAAPGASPSPPASRDGGEKKFDAIHVGAAAASLPRSLVDALKPGGRMVIPLGPEGGDQVLSVVDKDPRGGPGFKRTDLLGVRFVPLTEPGRNRHGGL